jgi:hypothetical protein
MSSSASSDVAHQVTQALERVRNPVFHAKIVTELTGNKLSINVVLTELQARVKTGQLREVGMKNGARLFERVKVGGKAPPVAKKPVAAVAVAAAAAAAASSSSSSPSSTAPNPVSFMGFNEDEIKDAAATEAAFDPESDFM